MPKIRKINSISENPTGLGSYLRLYWLCMGLACPPTQTSEIFWTTAKGMTKSFAKIVGMGVKNQVKSPDCMICPPCALWSSCLWHQRPCRHFAKSDWGFPRHNERLKILGWCGTRHQKKKKKPETQRIRDWLFLVLFCAAKFGSVNVWWNISQLHCLVFCLTCNQTAAPRHRLVCLGEQWD